MLKSTHLSSTTVSKRSRFEWKSFQRVATFLNDRLTKRFTKQNKWFLKFFLFHPKQRFGVQFALKRFWKPLQNLNDIILASWRPSAIRPLQTTRENLCANKQCCELSWPSGDPIFNDTLRKWYEEACYRVHNDTLFAAMAVTECQVVWWRGDLSQQVCMAGRLREFTVDRVHCDVRFVCALLRAHANWRRFLGNSRITRAKV